MAPITLNAVAPTGLSVRLSAEVLPGLEALLERLSASPEAWHAAVGRVFAPSLPGTLDEFAQRAEQLRLAVAEGSFSVPLQLRSAVELGGALAAYTADGGGDSQFIYLNAGWADSASSQEVARVLLEEIGHAFDHWLNPGADTAGDEGEAFATLLLNGSIDPSAQSEEGAGESGILWIDGAEVKAEFATYTFSSSYKMVYDLNNNGVIEGNQGETPAAKEQSSHNFNTVNLGQVKIDDAGSSSQFSGNDVSASAVVIGGKVYYGWISRPIKSGGQVQGFYFWTDKDFVSLGLAQQDGNADADNNSGDNSGFLLVVSGKESYFTGQSTTSVVLNNAKDGNLGQVNYATVSSSSDRVDTALNALPAPPVFLDATDTDGDGAFDVDDIDDDNDGILDRVEQGGSGSVDLANLVQFTYAQTAGVGGVIAGYPSRHDAAAVYGTGDRNDPKNFFDGNNLTELRVHLGDIFEFYLGTSLGAGSTLRIFEDPTGANDAPIAIYGSLGTTDAAGNANNASGGGMGWTNLQSKIGSNTAVKLYEGPSNSTLNLTLPIGIDHIQIVGLGTHGGWADLTVTASVDNTADFDKDGIINSLDLDSDNDGISDLYESVESLPSASVVQADINKDGTINLAEARAISGISGDNDVNKNGLWDFLEPSGGSQGNTPHNGDGDALADFTDLDSDDDGIPDTVEARGSAGFLVNDGDVSNDDLDGDGVIGLFDTTNDASGAGKVFGGSFNPAGPVNTDDSLGGDGLSFDVNGEPTVATVKSSVDYTKGSTTLTDIRVVHFQDSAYAKINKSGDQWVVDLGGELPVGAKILLRASSDSINKRNKLFVYASDASGGAAINQVGATGLAFATSGKTVYQNFEISLTTTTRFLKLNEVAVGGKNDDNEFRIDTLTWGYGGSGESKPVYDYLDSDSDNDGLDDVLESGLVLSRVDANGDGIDDAVQASVQDPDGKLSLPSDPTTGLQLRLDNVDLQPVDFDYRSLNLDASGNPGAAISNVTVNEGSPFANYQVTGTAGKAIRLRFKDLGVGTGYASKAVDYKAGLSEIQVFSGGVWVAYDDASGVTLDGSGNALVRVEIINDDAYEGPEQYKLEGYDASGAVASGGFSVIVDDGTGDYFDPSNNTATPNPVDASGQVLDVSGSGPLGEGSPVILDDDRPVSITNVIVNEGTQWAVFTLSGSRKPFALELQPGATKPASLWDGNIPNPPNDPSGLKDFGPTIQIRNPETGVWEAYTASTVLSLPVDPSTNVVGNVQVRVAIQNDPLLETDSSGNGERFNLIARDPSSNDVITDGGLGIILDNGTGSIFGFDASGNPIVDPAEAVYDNDLPVSVSNVLVNEGSPYAVFDLEGAPNQAFTLSLVPTGVKPATDASGAALGALPQDYGTIAQIQILDEATGEWVNYSPANGAALNSLGELEVRVKILNDDLYEGPETFKLIATSKSTGFGSFGGLGTIIDDGTGTVFNEAGEPDPSANRDDDRGFTVTGGSYNEASAWAFFAIAGGPNQLVSLDLSGNTATAWDGSGSLGPSGDPLGLKDFGPTLQYLDASGAWVTYSGGTVSLDPSGNLQVRASLNQDPLYETFGTTASGETFSLVVLSDSGKQSSGLAYILDNGQGDLFDSSGNPIIGPKDNDLPSLSVIGPVDPASEGSPLLFTVKLGSSLPSSTTVKLSLTDFSTEPNDYQPDLNDSTFNQAFYLDETGAEKLLPIDPSGQLTLPAGVDQFYVRLRTTPDDVFEGLEEFGLTAVLPELGGLSGSATGGIIDDGTGKVYTGLVDPSGQPAADPSGTPDNDIPTLTVTTLTEFISEGSRGVFRVSLDKTLENPAPLTLQLSGGPASREADVPGDVGFEAQFQVSWVDSNGTLRTQSVSSVDGFSGTIDFPEGVKDLFVRVLTVADDVYEGSENFQLAANLDLGGTPPTIEAVEFVPVVVAGPVLQLTDSDDAFILDDGTGIKYTGSVDPSGSPQSDPGPGDNDIPALTVTSLIPEISEGNSGLFRIDLSKPLAFTAPLNLGLRNGTAESNDYGFPPAPQVFYLDGSGNRQFLSLDGSGNVDLPVGVSTLYAVVGTTQDGVYEGDETFFLDARLNLPGSVVDPSGSASALISDDGSAPVYEEDGSGNPLLDGGQPITDASGVPDDDRPKTLTITPPNETVSEGSPAVFKVSLGGVSDFPMAVALNLSDVTTEPGDYNPVLNPFDVYFLDSLGNPQLLIKDLSGNYIVPPGVQDFYVIVRTNDDAIFEGLEQFNLNGTLVSIPGVSGPGTAGIIDDGSGTTYTGGLDPSGNPAVDPSGVRDDDRGALVVTTLTPDVSEGSTALFRVTLGSVLADPAPLRLVLTGITAEGNDYGFDPNGLQILYRDASGNPAATSLDASGTFIVPAGITSFTVKVNTIDDDVFEGSESFRLTATLLADGANPASDADEANILDDGTGTPYTGALDASGNPIVGPGPADDDIPSFSVTSLTPTISEGQSGLFRIDLGNPLELATPLNLSLRNGTAESDDYGFAPLGQVFYLDASGERVFLNIDGSGNVDLPGGVTALYVVVPTTADDVFEGPESFFLDARLNLPGAVADPSGSATSVIADDGSAPVYQQDPSGNPLLDPSGSGNPVLDNTGIPSDDDRKLSIEGRNYNEASLYMFWTVRGEAGQPLRFLGLSGDPSGADPATDLSGNLQYRDVSGIWQTLDASANPVLDASGTLLVRQAVVNDTTPEGGENFSLTLGYPNGGPQATGVSGLYDDGRGRIPLLDASGNPVLDASGIPQKELSKVKDDDRVLNVTGRAYNEAAPWMFWNVTGAPGQIVKFVSLGGDSSGADPNVDLSGNLQYRDVSGNWQTFDASSNPVLDASGTLLIRKAVVNDKTPEGRETFNLVVENTGGTDASGASSLNDDGTGRIPSLDASGNPTGFDASGNPVPDLTAVKDDDRVLGVASSTVNEASPFTFFKVEGAPGQLVSLALNPGTAEPGSDYTSTIEYSGDGGKTWTLYTPQTGLVPLSQIDGTLLVRVPILNDLPPVDEPDETFQLIATNTGGTSGTGTATIVDDGNGTIYKPDGSIDASGVPDNDALPPRLVPTDDGQGLKVIGQAGKSLFVDLSVVMADASLQNSFDLFKVSANGARTRIGAIGATPESGFFGDNRYQFVVGEELRFVQVSSDLPANSTPDLQIGGTDGCIQIGLDDDGGDGDADDLMIKVKTSSSDPYPQNTRMAALQKGSELAYLDLSWIGANGITLNLEVQTNAGDLNSIGLVRVDTDASGVPLGSVDGVLPTQGTLFDAAVRRKLLSYSYSQTGDQTLTAPSLTLTADQAGVYAPVLSTQAGNLYTFGSLSSSDRRQHVKVLGANSFAFEDAPAGSADWDYNDFVVSFQVADPGTPRLVLSADGQGLTVVGGTGPAEGLWLDLNTVLAKAGNQNSFDLFRRDASGALTQISSVGATSRGTFMGGKELFLGVGETLTFVQNSNDNTPDAAPSLLITQIGERFRVALDDEGLGRGDGDFNDLVVDIDRTPLDPCQEVVQLANLQRTSSAGLLDLSAIGEQGLKLNLAIQTDSGNTNTLSFVKLDANPTTGEYSVDGVAAGNSDAFRQAVRDNLVDFRVSAGGQGEADPAVWQLVAGDKGLYAAVLLTPDNEVYTFGDNTAVDGRQHLKVLGDSSFGFEDQLANKGADFDYNDFVVKITPV
jgi:hypothetical protein